MNNSTVIFLSSLVGMFFTLRESPAQSQKDDHLIEQLLRSRSDLFGAILERVDSYEVQILYTQIDRDRKNRPSFRSYQFRVNPEEYFYPASTVKLPAAALSLEKLNDLSIRGVNKYTSLRIDSAYSGQTSATEDSSAENGLPSVAHYIEKIFLVSDNDAFNRLYEFLGQQYLNEALWNKGFTDLKIIRRLSVAYTIEQNRYTNPFAFLEGQEVLYRQPLVFNPYLYENELKTTRKGKGYIENGALIESPKDFSHSNYVSLENLQRILRSVLFPDAVPVQERFNLTDDDYQFLYKCMSMLPRESKHPVYDTTTYYDSYVKYFLFGDSKDPIPSHIRIFNKVGEAYGYLIDNAYVVDFENKVEFLLTAIIYVNEDQIFNDDKYEYDEIGRPFLSNLGQVINEYEKVRQRPYLPDLERFKVDDDD